LWQEDPNTWQQSWAPQAHWSPNGRYLAVVRTKGQPGVDFSDLIVLDAATGKLYQIDPTKLSPAGLEKQGQHFVTDVAWAPDNRHLAAIGRVHYWIHSSREMQFANRLFLLDFLTGQSVQASSAELSGLRWPNGDLFWSSDGSKLTVSGARGLLLLSVQKRAQP
jgi:Tol biopolymer transport system component